MDASLAGIAGGVVGVLAGVVGTLAYRARNMPRPRDDVVPQPLVPPGAVAVLSVLRSSVLLVDPSDEVLTESMPARLLGIVDGSRLGLPSLISLVSQVRADRRVREAELVVPSGRRYETHITARVAPLGTSLILVLIEDKTHERRVDAIRRDFVVNVSHELKTPVGALRLLAEAVAEAAGDPEAVQRFSTRMLTESERLNRLVQQIIELSRLQGDDPLDNAERVNVDLLAANAIDRVKVDAADNMICVEYAGVHGLEVLGDHEQLASALGNLVENAVNYSEAGQRVLISTRLVGENLEISVTDHGMGIPMSEIDRIFERFYRVDPARARATGGTGLGLSIVKHVVATHGGDVRVWSVEGEGSTFTIALPALIDRLDERHPLDRPSLREAHRPDVAERHASQQRQEVT